MMATTIMISTSVKPRRRNIFVRIGFTFLIRGVNPAEANLLDKSFTALPATDRVSQRSNGGARPFSALRTLETLDFGVLLWFAVTRFVTRQRDIDFSANR